MRDDPVFLQIESESGTRIVEIERRDAQRIRKLLEQAVEEGDWPDQVNELLDEGSPIRVFGIVNTMGDGWGWYSPRGR